jgi:uncharacterized delta-60 repeat protein
MNTSFICSESTLMPQNIQRSIEGIVFIDGVVEDCESLMASVMSGFEAFVLDSEHDGVVQISTLLADYHNLKSLHIVSHGRPGAVQLGNGWLSAATINQNTDDLMVWAKALAADAELLIYGCEVAKGEKGRALIAQLGEWTGACVAASETKTGASALEGNWDLEVKTGDITSDLVFQPLAMAAYAYVLAAGDLDLTFGIGGKVIDRFNNNFNEARDVIVQPDGKIVLAGFAFNGISGYDFVMSRYNSDGSLDTTFGTGGRVITDFSGSEDEGFSVLQQSDGRIVVAGYTFDASGGIDFAVSRYSSDGSLDTTFGTGGRVTTDFNGSEDQGLSVLQQSDGKIVVAGLALNASGDVDFAVSRYNSDGSLDPTFGTGGKVTTDFNGNGDRGFSVLQQSDGKIVVVGDAYNGGFNLALCRYNSDGSLDPTFGAGGKVTTDFNGSEYVGRSVLQQGDGKIVVAGLVYNASVDFGLSRYNNDGSLDLTFGTGGKVTTDFNGSDDFGLSMLQQSDGKIVMAGHANDNVSGSRDFVLSRYNSDGSLDPTFGTGGKVTTDFNGKSDSGFSLALQPDGKIILVGSSNGNFAIVRYLGDNQPPINTVPVAQSVN